MKNRFLYKDPSNPNKYDDQLSMALAVLYSLQGIPCLYYGTEQGLCGHGDIDWAVREALWGKHKAFNTNSNYFKAVQSIIKVRAEQPALRYGRQYFRPVDTGGDNYYICSHPLDVMSFSRILNDQEVLVVCNPKNEEWYGSVLVDFSLNSSGQWETLYSNKGRSGAFPTRTISAGNATIDGNNIGSSIRVSDVNMEPMEVLILGQTQ